MHALTFTINLLEPVLIAQLTRGDPNSSRGLRFIPGSVLRGLVANHYLGGAQMDARDADFRRLFLDGRTRFLNAYPLSRQGRRTLPTPLSWFTEKGKPEHIFDFAVAEVENLQAPQGVKKPFCDSIESDGDYLELYEPKLQVNIHTFREEAIKKHESTVFRYEAIAADQKFGGVILSDDASDLNTLKNLLDGLEADIGRSRTAGYGHIRCEDVQIHSDWSEYTLVGDADDQLIITMLSDTLVRDDSGSYTAELTPITNVKHSRAYVKTRVVGGFNRKWGSPLPQAWAIQAGSVFVYPYSSQLEQRLRGLEQKGIGERRAEGFGRITVNWHGVPKWEVKKLPLRKPLPISLQSDSAKLARQMVERMFRAELDRALIQVINQTNIRPPRPSNSQLSRVRLVLRRALAAQDLNLVVQHMKDMRSTARKQFDNARVGGQRLSHWLTERAKDPEGIWNDLQAQGKVPSIGGIKPEQSDALALEYTVRLVDGVLRKAIKEADR